MFNALQLVVLVVLGAVDNFEKVDQLYVGPLN